MTTHKKLKHRDAKCCDHCVYCDQTDRYPVCKYTVYDKQLDAWGEGFPTELSKVCNGFVRIGE